jgi:riboflavin biosynthesis pyrimidine reductase/predicted DsbA family dithiol-disulfide isomerase
MSLTIPVAHDFVCEWCWIGLHQAARMRREFGVAIEWRGYELYPATLDSESVAKPTPIPLDKPLTPSRLTLAFAAQGLKPVRRPVADTHAAHEAVEFAKLSGAQDELVERIYRAYWAEGQDISMISILLDAARGVVDDLEGLEVAIRERRFAQNITPFNDPAYDTGVFNLPTFWIGGERYAEQPWVRLEAALNKVAEQEDLEPDFYSDLEIPMTRSHESRPTVFINMVATIDGKIITGNRGEPVEDLGSKTDHAMMRRIQHAAEGVLVGAGAQRSSAKIWYPKHLYRFVATKSGRVLERSRFFDDYPDRAYVICPDTADVSSGLNIIRCGEHEIDWRMALEKIRAEFGIRKLLVEGGSDINAQLLRLGLVDELFLTVAPKIKLGADTPTYADGLPLKRDEVQDYTLVEQHVFGNEVFLRYRRR